MDDNIKKNEESEENNIDDLNKGYLKEMEANNFLFEEKMNKLNNLISSNNKNKKNDDIKEKMIINDFIINKKENNNEINYNNLPEDSYLKNDYKKRDLVEDTKSFNEKYNGKEYISRDENKFKCKSQRNDKNNDKIKYNENNKENISSIKIMDLEKKINQLNNENNYKNNLIEDLKFQIKQKSNGNLNENEYNSLLKEKNEYIDKLKKEIKDLRFRNDNLILENKKMKNENDNLISQKEELKAELDSNKLDYLNNSEKINKLEFMHKKLNKDYLILSNDFKLLKNENEKLKSIIEEQNNIIFNYKKQLNNNTSKRNYNELSKDDFNQFKNRDEKKNEIERKNNDIYDYDKYNYDKNDYDKNENFNYKYKYEIQNNKIKYDDEMQKEEYNPYSNFKGKYNYKINENINNIFEKNRKAKKGELNYLENYLSGLLKERTQLEKSFSEIPEHPRTLKDIKLKNSIKDKIIQNDKEVFNTQNQLKKIRGN